MRTGAATSKAVTHGVVTNKALTNGVIRIVANGITIDGASDKKGSTATSNQVVGISVNTW